MDPQVNDLLVIISISSSSNSNSSSCSSIIIICIVISSSISIIIFLLIFIICSRAEKFLLGANSFLEEYPYLGSDNRRMSMEEM